MSTLRASKPLLQNCCKFLGPRSFHTVPRVSEKARRAPKLAQKSARISGTPPPGAIRVKKAFDPEEALPPIVLLRSGSKSGALEISPDKALEVLREYQVLARSPGSGWERKLCSDHGTTPSTLALLARILNRCPNPAQRHLARKVMLSASSLGESSATYELIEAALLKSTLHLSEFATPLKRLGTMATTEQDPQAMALLGRVMQGLSKLEDALSWFRKSTRLGHDFDGASEALVQEGRILLARKDKEGAEIAFRKAAIELDDPNGYFYLSQLHEEGSKEREVYLLKAASSGLLEACHNLASLELAKAEGGKSEKLMAMEWFEVAAAGGYGPSMVNLATLYRMVGREEEGLEWLNKAAEVREVEDQAKMARGLWRET